GEHRAEETHRKRVGGILAHHGGRERNEGLAPQKERVQPRKPVVGTMRQTEHVVVIEPEFADNDETDQPAQELGRELNELMSKFADAGVVLERGQLQLEHQQGHHDREDAVAEKLHPLEVQMSALETSEWMHDHL